MDFHYYHTSQAKDNEARKKARQNSKGVKENSSRLEQVELQLDHLTNIVQALWGVIKDETELSDETLKSRVEKVITDNAEQATAKMECGNCSQITSKNRDNCMYCGHSLSLDIKNNLF